MPDNMKIGAEICFEMCIKHATQDKCTIRHAVSERLSITALI